MSDGGYLLGIVRDGRFNVLLPEDGAGTVARLTTLQMQAGQPLENGMLNLAGFEGQALLVTGQLRDDWVYQAQVVEQAGPILTLVAGRMFAPGGVHGVPQTAEPQPGDEHHQEGEADAEPRPFEEFRTTFQPSDAVELYDNTRDTAAATLRHASELLEHELNELQKGTAPAEARLQALRTAIDYITEALAVLNASGDDTAGEDDNL